MVDDLKDQVQDYATQLAGSNSENAWHSLVELGPAAALEVAAAFEGAKDIQVKTELLEVLCHYRTKDLVPLFVRLLHDGHDDIWKTALDGLVTIGSNGVVRMLRDAERTLPPTRHAWIREAIEQIEEQSAP